MTTSQEFTNRIEKLIPQMERQARHLATLAPDQSADDILQNSLLKLWAEVQKNPEILNEADVYFITFTSWKGKSMAKSSRTYNRYVDCEMLVQDDDGEEETTFSFIRDETASPEVQYIETETIENLYNQVAEMGENELMVVKLLHLGYKQVEIAEKLGVTKGRVTQIRNKIAAGLQI